VLRIAEVERPAPADDEVLVRVHASTVSQTDTHIRRPDPFVWRIFGLRRPRWRTPGVEFAGTVESVGSAVTEFKAGDQVFGQPTWVGANAEFVSVRESRPIAHKPAGLTFEEAAAVCDGANQALATLRVANVQPGQRIVIYGASGSLGTAAVQLAKHMGATVTAVCGTHHVEAVRALGPDQVVDYQGEDFTAGGPDYDAVIDAVGKGSFRRARRALKPGGIYVATDGVRNFFWWFWTRFVGERRLKFASGRRSKQDVVFVKGLIEAGRYRPVVDRVFPLEQVAEAHRYVEAWHKLGNVVLTVSGGRAEGPS
jgi:NADPH:quinone reductase-like Zn-dependent oxidoreductase